MTVKEFKKVALSSGLFFVVAALSLLHKRFEHVDYMVPYIFYDADCWCFDRFTENPYEEQIKWVFNSASNRLIPVILFANCIIKPDMERWGFNLDWMSFTYYLMIFVSFVVAYEKIPFRVHIDVFVLSVHFMYVLECYLMTKGRRLKDLILETW